MRKYLFLGLVSSVFFVMGCKKVEGPGGSSSITGKIHAKIYDGANNLINEYDIMEYDVYLIYGDDPDDTFYDDDVETSYDGTFRFDYLERGKYTVFVYEKCPTCPSGKSVIFKATEIVDKKSEIDLGIIDVRK